MMMAVLLKALFLACFRSPFPGIVFPLSQNRQPGVGTRVIHRRQQTRHASFFTSLLRYTHFSGCGVFTVASVR